VILEERLQVDNSHWSDGRDVVGYGLQGASSVLLIGYEEDIHSLTVRCTAVFDTY